MDRLLQTWIAPQGATPLNDLQWVRSDGLVWSWVVINVPLAFPVVCLDGFPAEFFPELSL